MEVQRRLVNNLVVGNRAPMVRLRDRLCLNPLSHHQVVGRDAWMGTRPGQEHPLPRGRESVGRHTPVKDLEGYVQGQEQ